MELHCPSCQRVLHYSGDCPSFCAYCGNPIPRQASTIDVAVEPPTVAPGPPTPAPEAETLASPGASGSATTPETVGGYRLLQRLGGGGMGEVFEAEASPGGRRVAVKLIGADHAESPDAVERFRREGRLASGLAHPRCVFVYAADEDAGRPFIVMELMPGKTLQQLVDERGPLPADEAVALILDVIEGLSEAHALGVIHRDVKPSNCFLEANGRVKIGDFGLAKSLTAGDTVTKTGAFLGTMLYASPEQVRRDPLDAQSDLYSVAATLYFLLTGQAPFQGGDAVATVARIVSEPAPSLRDLRPSLSPGLERVVLRGLERERARRYRNLEDLRQALLPFASSQPSAAPLLWRFGAYLVDVSIIELAPRLLEATILVALNLAEAVAFDAAFGIALDVVAIAYFAITEGIGGRSPGKRLFGLSVSWIDGVDPPGVGRALRRAFVFQFFGLAASILLTLNTLSVVSFLDVGWTSTMLLAAGCVVPLLGMRRRSGYRGLHERLSGTRTLQLERAGRPLVEGAIPSLRASASADLPERVGPFLIRGLFRSNANEQILLAEDPALGRPALVRRRLDCETDECKRHALARATRSRWLAAGRDGDWRWDAFLVSPGRPLAEVVGVRKPLSWTRTRHVLEQLAEELAAAESDGSVPSQMTADQVWLRRGGRVLLLDFSLHEHAADDPPRSKPGSQAVALLGAVALLALEGRERSPGDRTSVRAPIPVHARDLVNRLLGHGPAFSSATEFGAALAASRAKPTELTVARRASQLLTLGTLHFPGLALLVLAGFLYSVSFLVEVAEGKPLDFRRAARALDIRASADLAAGLMLPQVAARLEAGRRWQEDQRDLERLRELEHSFANRAKAMRRSGSWGVGFSFDQGAEQRLALKHLVDGELPLDELSVQNARNRAEIELRSYPRNIYPTDLVRVVIIGFAIVPGIWTVWAWLTRGGFNHWLHDLTLVGADGRKAGRLRCAWRTLLVWTPFAGILCLSVMLDYWYWSALWNPGDPYPMIPLLSWLTWWAGVAMLPLWLVLALRFPQRGLHDWLAGTYLVPK